MTTATPEAVERARAEALALLADVRRELDELTTRSRDDEQATARATDGALRALGFAAGTILNNSQRPARVSLKAQASRAALAAAHVNGLLDSITDPQMRHAAALALAALEYIKAAAGAGMNQALLAAAKEEQGEVA